MWKYLAIFSLAVVVRGEDGNRTATTDILVEEDAKRIQDLRDSIHCLLMGGTPTNDTMTRIDVCTIHACPDKPKTEEECTKKGGKYDKWCLEAGKCVASICPDKCFMPIPKELMTPISEEWLQYLFSHFEASQSTVAPADGAAKSETQVAGASAPGAPAEGGKAAPKIRRRRMRRRL